MRIRLALFVGTAALLCGAATLAADDKPKPKAPEPGTSVEMPYLIAPVIVDGKLLANAYVSNKVIATSTNAAMDIRDKTPFIQDAFVRDVNAKPINKDSDPPTVDQAALQARLLADARRIAGAAKVANLKIIQIQVVPVRPGGAP
ncbi:MAG: hypothetical protein WBQ17_11235 [Rhizomicrobium sp.]